MKQAVLVLGTTNRKKRNELESLLALPELDLWTLDRFTRVPEVVETGSTFRENATLKAVTLATALGHWVLGEDSGLVVDALGGAPGICSARYAGEPCNDERNNDKLLSALASVPADQRTAHYVCTAVLADPGGRVRAQAEGRCDGIIASRRFGSGGFGYDPLFIVADLSKTFGELPPEVKMACSHRAAAIRQLRPQLVALLEAGEWRRDEG
jgi:XTP/dITP diphosphohydrolase